MTTYQLLLGNRVHPDGIHRSLRPEDPPAPGVLCYPSHHHGEESQSGGLDLHGPPLSHTHVHLSGKPGSHGFLLLLCRHSQDYREFFSVDRSISFYECMRQFYFLCLAETTDDFLLTAMAYDHYIGHTQPTAVSHHDVQEVLPSDRHMSLHSRNSETYDFHETFVQVYFL